MKTIAKITFILVVVSNICHAQEYKSDSYNVGFRLYKTFDSSRHYIIDQDTVKRPLLIHYWYPCKADAEFNEMTFKDYIDLISVREDFDKEEQEINNTTNGYVNAYLGFAKHEFGIDTSITTQEVLQSPVKAKLNATPISDSFPLIIYAPSNSKSSVQNHIMCEYLASKGYHVLSVGSAGYESLKRKGVIRSTLAQVKDIEFIINYFRNTLHIKYQNIGLLGFSSGSAAVAVYQMTNSEVKAVISLDGSHEYSYYLTLYKMENFDLSKTNAAYCMFANYQKDISFYPYYNSIMTSDKYLYKMPFLNHNGFISYWKQFDMCSAADNVNKISESYDVLCEHVSSCFDFYLKSNPGVSENFKISNNEIIYKDTTDYTVITSLLNSILTNGIDSSISKIKADKRLYENKDNLINILGRMYMGFDNSIASKIFLINTELQPESWEAQYNLAYFYKEAKEIEPAKVAIERAKEINPDNNEIQILFDEIISLNN